jgi:hypothetical protein
LVSRPDRYVTIIRGTPRVPCKLILDPSPVAKAPKSVFGMSCNGRPGSDARIVTLVSREHA